MYCTVDEIVASKPTTYPAPIEAIRQEDTQPTTSGSQANVLSLLTLGMYKFT